MMYTRLLAIYGGKKDNKLLNAVLFNNHFENDFFCQEGVTLFKDHVILNKKFFVNYIILEIHITHS